MPLAVRLSGPMRDFERVRIIDRPSTGTTDQRGHGHRSHERRVLRQRVGLADELAVFQVGSLLADGVQPVIDPLQRVLSAIDRIAEGGREAESARLGGGAGGRRLAIGIDRAGVLGLDPDDIR